MPKILTSTALSLIQQKTATEPYYVVIINWGTGLPAYFSTRAVEGRTDLNVNIKEVGDVQNRKSNDSQCNVANVKITFSDLDGLMKFTVDNRVVEGAPAALYLAFIGASQADWVPLVVGKTAGPISWDEKNRTFELEIETIIESNDLGYSATSDDFNDINPEAEGVPWPIIFGQCQHVPALHFKKRASTFLQFALRTYVKPIYKLTDTNDITMVGNPDLLCYTDDIPDKNILYVLDSGAFPRNTDIGIIIDDVVFRGYFVDDFKFFVTQSNAPKYTNVAFDSRPSDDPDKDNNHVGWLRNPIPIVNHHCYLQAPGGIEWSNFCVRQEGVKCWFRYPFIAPSSTTGGNIVAVLVSSGYSITEVFGITKCGMLTDMAGTFTQLKNALSKRGGSQNVYGLLMAQMDSAADKASSWWSVPPDTEVRLWDPPDSDIYVASLIELDSIEAVYGKRKVNLGGKTRTIFAPIPESYYSVVNGSYDVTGQTPTALIFDKPLGDYAGQGWENDIYVSATSTIGPNPSDIVKWLINNYTDVPTYNPSFSAIRGSVAGTPANFALFDKRDAMKVAKEIAFQARCSLIFDLGGVAIKFLPVEGLSAGFYNQSNMKNVVLNWTETKEVKTRFIASYTPTYRDNHHLDRAKEVNIREFERVLRSLVPTDVRQRSETKYVSYYNNVAKYGLRTREEAAYIFNDIDPVELFSSFWGFRFSNVWRTIQFDTWLPGTFLQPFDLITVDLAVLNQSNVPAVVESINFNPKTHITTIQATIPIKAGQGSVEADFWPEGI